MGDRTVVCAFHYSTVGQSYKSFGAYTKCGILYNQHLQPSFPWYGTGQLACAGLLELEALCEKAERQVAQRYTDQKLEGVVMRALPSATLGAARLLEDAHLAMVLRILGPPLGDSLEYFAPCASVGDLEIAGLANQP